MAKNKNWFDEVPTVKPTTARMVRFGNVAQKLVPGATAVFDTVYMSRQPQELSVRQRAEQVKKAEATDFVLQLVSE